MNKTTKEKIEELQQVRISEIVDSQNLTQLEKLKLLESEQLFEYYQWLAHEFINWEKEYEDILLLEGIYRPIIDTIYSPSETHYERHEIISYPDTIQDIIENNIDDDGKVTVLTNRSNDTVFKKTEEEVINELYNFCISNKIIGFKNDW